MRVIAHEDIGEFAREVMPWLGLEPVRHNLIANLIDLRVRGARPAEEGIVLWKVVDEQDTIAGVAIRTPPVPMLILTELPPEGLEAVAAAAKAQGLQRFHGIQAQRLAELAAGGAPTRRVSGSALHRLRRVVPPEGVPGHARFADPSDVALAFGWVKGFQRDVGDEEPIDVSQVEGRVADGGLWLWEHAGRPVSMAAWSTPVHGVVRVNLVYTPPGLRGNGYASALVATISQAILDQGHVPILYTDLANPTSNKIYAAVGYEKVEEPQAWGIFPPVPATAVEAVNNLAARWAQTIGPGGTTAFSAASVWPLLALLGDAAHGPARTELLSAIGPVGPAGDPRSVALNLIRALDSIPQVHAALGVWVRDGVPLTELWASAMVLTGQATLDAWAARHTGGLIPRMPVTIDQDTLLVLAGALALRFPWRRPFEPGFRGELHRHGTDFDSVAVVDTPQGPLTRVCVEGTGEVDVNLLVGELSAGIRSLAGDYPVTAGSRLLETGGTGPGVEVIEVRSWDPSPELHLVTTAFTIEARHDLLGGDNAVLFGLSTAADTSRGHFPGISPKPLAISAARQDAMAAFSADGFEAAAVTAMSAVAGAALPSQTRRVLRVRVEPPFGFLAVHRPSGLVLTAGFIAK